MKIAFECGEAEEQAKARGEDYECKCPPALCPHLPEENCPHYPTPMLRNCCLDCNPKLRPVFDDDPRDVEWARAFIANLEEEFEIGGTTLTCASLWYESLRRKLREVRHEERERWGL